MKLLAQIFLSSLIILKIVLGVVFIYMVEFSPVSFEGRALALENKNEASKSTESEQQSNIKDTIDLKLLLKEKAELEEKGKILKEKEAELIAIQEDINKKIAELTKIRNEIRNKIAEQNAIEEQKFKHLVKAYSSMKPQRAAGLIEKLNIDFAVKLLSKMKGEEVGKILSSVGLEKAANISERLAHKK